METAVGTTGWSRLSGCRTNNRTFTNSERLSHILPEKFGKCIGHLNNHAQKFYYVIRHFTTKSLNVYLFCLLDMGLRLASFLVGATCSSYWYSWSGEASPRPSLGQASVNPSSGLRGRHSGTGFDNIWRVKQN